MSAENGYDLESQISQWRAYLHGRPAIATTDVEELEGHLRDQVEALTGSGLAPDEAFLVAVKRLGNLDALSREFAREHSERLWKQLVVAGESPAGPDGPARAEKFVVLGTAIAAALAIQIPGLFGHGPSEEVPSFFVRNMSFYVLPFLAGYFVWKRGSAPASLRWLVPSFIVAAVFANVYPFTPGGSTEILTMLHLPIALWLVVGVAYAGGHWDLGSRRMDFVRFSGELFIYYVLFALGGGVLTAFTLGMFQFIGFDLEWLAGEWIIPSGAMGAVIVGAWLVEAKQSVIENMAPVLTRVFTPLFVLSLLAFLATMILSGNGIDVEREVLIGFDLLLVLVLGLLLYAVSSRDPAAPPNVFDALQLLLVLSALVIDVLALTAIGGRIFERGITPNRAAALGENIILLVNLTWSAWLYFQFLRRRGSFAVLERWQTDYLPVYAIWAAIVVVGFPVIFGFR